MGFHVTADGKFWVVRKSGKKKKIIRASKRDCITYAAIFAESKKAIVYLHNRKTGRIDKRVDFSK